MATSETIAIYYEHPEWFRPLFAELERRGLPFEALRADELILDPVAGLPSSPTLFVNRMSPSAWERGRGGLVFETLHQLAALEARGIEVINGAAAYQLDIAKSRQAALLAQLGLRVPRTRIIHHPAQALEATAELVFPILVKPNMGGNGAGVQRFVDPEELRLALDLDALSPGPDGLLLVQEYHRPRGGSIVRAETLGGQLLYAIRIHLADPCSFSICPADVTRTVDGVELAATARAAGHGNDATVEAFTPSPTVTAEIEAIARAGRFEVGGVEYLESERDGQRYYYDINVLSNFIADGEKVVGFDPTARFVDLLQRRFEHRAGTPVLRRQAA